MPDRPRPASTTDSPTDATMAFAIDAARLLRDDKCEDVLVLDLRGRSQITDFFVIATGTSQRQMRSAGIHAEELAQERGVVVFSTNLGDRDTSWFILDIAGVVIHLFEAQTRTFYDLEMLWGDADRIDWRRPDQRGDDPPFDPGRNRAGLRMRDLPTRPTAPGADADPEDEGA